MYKDMKECAWCGQDVEYIRSSKMTHDGRCRKAFYRWTGRMEKQQAEVKLFLYSLVEIEAITRERRRYILMFLRVVINHAVWLSEKIIKDEPSLSYMKDLIIGDTQGMFEN